MRYTTPQQNAIEAAINLLATNTMLAALDMLQMHNLDQRVWNDMEVRSLNKEGYEITIRYNRPYTQDFTSFKLKVDQQFNLAWVKLTRHGQQNLNVALEPHQKASYRTIMGRIKLKMIAPKTVTPQGNYKARIKQALQTSGQGLWFD